MFSEDQPAVDDVLIQDEETYYIKEFGVYLLGRMVKDPEVFEDLRHEQETLRANYKKLHAPERYYRTNGETHVYQSSLDPPAYEMYESFDQLLEPIVDLSMPAEPGQIYYSTFLRAGDFIRTFGRIYDHYQRYTVEVFGLKMPWVPGDAFSKIVPRPDPSQYASPPRYWDKSRTEIVQIWRTRILHCALEDLKTSPTNPLSPYHPSFPYFQECWHPQQQRNRFSLGGFEGFEFEFPTLERFYSKARKILTNTHGGWGRPFGSGRYSDLETFKKAVMKAHSELWELTGNKPGQKEVAFRLDIPIGTFKHYWGKLEEKWNDLPPPDTIVLNKHKRK